MTVPTPIPVGSRKLSRLRYEASIHGPKNARGGRPEIAPSGRFLRFEDAKVWADAVHPDADFVSILFASARSGWRLSTVATRTEGEWDR